MKAFKPLVMAAAVIGTLGACTTAPETQTNAGLEQARLALDQVRRDTAVAQNAPEELKRAEDALRQAELAWRNTPGDARVDHFAYLARQRAAIARESADMKTAEQAVQQASGMRERLLLEARTREAEQAQEQIASSQSEAERARSQTLAQQQLAMTAQQRAERLQQQLSALEARETDRGLSVVLSGILFESGQAELKAGAARRLQQLAEILRENPDQIAVVEGFTDNVGDEARNAELSQRRAEAVRDTLATLGVDPSRVEVQGYGEAFPVASNRTPVGRQQNRRVEIVLTSQNSGVPQHGFVGPGSEPAEASGMGGATPPSPGTEPPQMHQQMHPQMHPDVPRSQR